MGCKASTEVGNVEPWGMYAAGKNEKKNEPRRGRPVGWEARTGSTSGDPWWQVQPSKTKKRFQRERPVGWGARAGSMVWDLKGSEQEADGQQRAT